MSLAGLGHSSARSGWAGRWKPKSGESAARCTSGSGTLLAKYFGLARSALGGDRAGQAWGQGRRGVRRRGRGRVTGVGHTGEERRRAFVEKAILAL